MQLRPDIQITSMIKAMTDVIQPAVDPTNKLAVEQSQLVVGMLSLMARQLPIQFAFDRDELARLLAGCGELKRLSAVDSTVTAAQDHLTNRAASAATVLERCTVDPSVLVVAICELRQAMGDIVQALGATDDLAGQLTVERIVLDLSKEQLLRDRALLVRQGFERDPAALPSIESLLSLSSAAHE
ncbi:MAG: hypothetical protein JSS57_15185 [Proteobacteria bacterium]|nr:hypothetical protein [Pseudomonadota bacterium]